MSSARAQRPAAGARSPPASKESPVCKCSQASVLPASPSDEVFLVPWFLVPVRRTFVLVRFFYVYSQEARRRARSLCDQDEAVRSANEARNALENLLYATRCVREGCLLWGGGLFFHGVGWHSRATIVSGGVRIRGGILVLFLRVGVIVFSRLCFCVPAKRNMRPPHTGEKSSSRAKRCTVAAPRLTGGVGRRRAGARQARLVRVVGERTGVFFFCCPCFFGV